MSHLSGKDVICFSDMEWADNPVSKMQIMARLARDNRVLFVETIGTRRPSLTSRRDLLRVARRFLKGWKVLRPVRDPVLGTRLTLLSPLALPYHNWPGVDSLNKALMKLYVRSAVGKLGFVRPILWFYSARFVPLIDVLEHETVVYHCVDDWSTYRGADSHEYRTLEERLFRSADFVFFSSRVLREKLEGRVRSGHHIGNGVNFVHISRTDVDPPPELVDVPRPLAIYVGTVSQWLDYQLIESVCRRLPKISFVFVGYVHDLADPSAIKKLKELKNVFLLGARSYEHLPRYYREASVCIAPFLVNEHILNSDPTKTYEYLATGKPIVATNFPTAAQFAQVISIAQSPDEFAGAITDRLREPFRGDQRIWQAEAAQNHSWENKLDRMAEIMNGRAGKSLN